MDEMMQEICKYSNGTYLIVEWEYGRVVLEGIIDTIYESNNGLDEEDNNYKEFYACAFKIKKICKNSSSKIYGVDNLIELSIENQPTLIALADSSIIWKK